MNYSNITGFILLISLLIQFISGLLSGSYYEDYVLFSYMLYLMIALLVPFLLSIMIIAIHTTGINLSILLIIIFVSNIVLINSIDYLGIIESVLFLVYICPLQFSMIMFILTNDLLISFINWDLLGINSYLLINY